MSKAFTKDDAPDDAIVVPPRAPLPPGVPNWVTARGLQMLRAELVALDAERGRILEAGDDPERQRRLAIATARLSELSARVASATLVDPAEQPRDVVRFGAAVTIRTTTGPRAGEERRFRIVGVDEADASAGRVAFVSPIARAILGLTVGDEALLRLPRGEESLEIVAIAYDEE